MFITFHIVGMLSYHSMWLGYCLILFYFLIGCWNGASYYMEYFSKKYEKQLAELQSLEQQTQEKENKKDD
jgi:hypothetical protein